MHQLIIVYEHLSSTERTCQRQQLHRTDRCPLLKHVTTCKQGTNANWRSFTPHTTQSGRAAGMVKTSADSGRSSVSPGAMGSCIGLREHKVMKALIKLSIENSKLCDINVL